MVSLRRIQRLPFAASRGAALVALTIVAIACSEASVPVLGFVHPTLVEVSPERFLGDVPCLDAPGAMRRYVATAYDLGPEGDGGAGGEASGEESEGFALPSSGPIPCTQAVGFARTVPNHRYRADIAGYDQDDLVELAPGVGVLVDPVTNERVEPRWTTSCGKRRPVTSVSGTVRTLGDCDPLVDTRPDGPAVVEARVDDALGDLTCGTAPGEVERFELTAPDGSSAGAACDEAARLEGLAPSRATQRFSLRAFEAGADEPAWGSTCHAEVIAGVTTRASCFPLSSTGSLEIEPEDALGALGLDCESSGFSELEIALADRTPRYVDRASCARPVRFLELDPGPVTARASVRLDGSMEPADTASCTATVAPGDIVRATCTREP